MKKTFALLTLAVLLIFAALPAFADDLVLLDGSDTADAAETVIHGVGGLHDPSLPRVVDGADLLDAEEEGLLAERIAKLTDDYDIDAVILTVYGRDTEDIVAYADDYYDYGGYGWGDGCDGLILVIDMEDRSWYISTYGEAFYIFTDYGIEQLGDTLVSYLAESKYYGGFYTFLDDCDDYIAAYNRGEPVDIWIPDDYDYDDVRSSDEFSIVPYLICLGVGLLVAFIVTAVMKGKLKTAVFQKQADDYMRRDTFDLMASEDTFLYSNVVATPRNTDSGSRSGGGGHYGGSSSHTSSSGRSHGGGGGHF